MLAAVGVKVLVAALRADAKFRVMKYAITTQDLRNGDITDGSPEIGFPVRLFERRRENADRIVGPSDRHRCRGTAPDTSWVDCRIAVRNRAVVRHRSQADEDVKIVSGVD